MVKSLVFFIFCLIFFNAQVHSQSIEVGIEYDNEIQNSNRVRKKLKKIDSFFLVFNDNEELSFSYSNDCFVFQQFSDSQIEYLSNNDMIKTKLIYKRKCYLTYLPTYEILASLKKLNVAKIYSFSFYSKNKTLYFHYYLKLKVPEELKEEARNAKLNNQTIVIDYAKYVNKKLLPCDRW